MPENSNRFLIFSYIVTTLISMGAELLTVTIATFCSMFGPGKALMGGEGA